MTSPGVPGPRSAPPDTRSAAGGSGAAPGAAAEQLLGRLTLDEKLQMLHQYAPELPRLGLASFRTGTEVLHGLAWLGPATVFPQAVGLAATWDPDLLEAVGDAVGREVRERHRDTPAVGLNVWGPVVNLLRDPRWGRNDEGYSEDPYLTAELAIGYCRGLRGGGSGERPAVLTTAPTLKHFLGYNHETDKATTSADIRPRILYEYDLRPFEWIIKAGVVSGLMLSYNRVNGRPCHTTPLLGLLRSWQPDLVVVSDAYGTKGMVEDHRYFPDHPHAYAAALRTGLDSFTEDSGSPADTVAALREAMALGLINEADVDAAVRRLLRMRIRLGEGTGCTRAPAGENTSVDHRAHQDLALAAARKAVVLLRNDRDLLPLDGPGPGRIVVIGPHADKVLVDWVSGTLPYERAVVDVLRDRLGPDAVDFIEGVDRVELVLDGGLGHVVAGPVPDGSPLRARSTTSGADRWFDVLDWGDGIVTLRSVANHRFVSRGDDGVLANTAAIPYGWFVPEAFRLVPAPTEGWSYLRHVYSGRYVTVVDGVVVASAKAPEQATRLRLATVSRATDGIADRLADAAAVLVVVGTHPLINGREGQDRTELSLPARQEEVARSVVSARPDAVVAIVSGWPPAIPWLAGHARALLWSAHGGQEQGTAIVDVILGTHAPAGRLPQTWYHGAHALGEHLDYDIIGSRKTYLYDPAEPLFPFGHGLTYARFRYGEPRITPTTLRDGDRCRVSVEVTNTGPVDSDEVVQLYVRTPGEAVRRPVRELRGFRRVHLKVGQTVRVSFELAVADLAYWDVANGRFAVEPGRYEVEVGRSSTHCEGRAPFQVIGAPPAPRDMSRRLVRAVDHDDAVGVATVDEARGGGDAVEARRPGAWLCYRNVEMSGVNRLVAQASNTTPSTATVEVRLDDPFAGELVGALEVPVVDGEWSWRTVEGPARGDGRHDVYVVLPAHVRLASIGLVNAPRPLGELEAHNGERSRNLGALP
ncbi:glycoside hydrolase family 3 C-terminal domain-containing protein [Polymorphospora lycopeni]|uniref:Glycoside hydrolase family 3 C-terminal domain-containing protein n=1 Tax=Polymorphospora lycopeni TaxID=3140240 RepID=A0ABV5CQE6_9ACTN